ncbi:ATP-dependent RNA helicase RhlB [Alkalispirochaeta americana]|uniref:ATP-dependent RNA helicase RhlB n=1 Tax=Alkalispirochaeta americana TaxID=159291 RepID=A0A1N6NCR0_9SPIO|nr:DEAD/DEAH box helicase [Alkalispirochaeta americana]SIP89868.1 ATP-dependent RNA helicase RhlB [Alkalispirochaeta americana]
MKFDELQLDSAILSGVAAAGFEECTPVQAQAIPLVLDGRDVMVQSQTGTGKTAAFLLPTFHLLLHNERFRGTTAIVIAPTRELAVQIKDEANLLAEGLPLSTEVFHGGVGYEGQQKALSQGVNILVGTPGRILDLSQSGSMDLRTNGVVIIDEADRLLDMGFYPDLRKMLRRMRPREERLNMLFSATLGTKARNIAWEHMNNPAEIEVAPEQVTVDKVQQELLHVASRDKMSVLLGILERDQPRNAIVFTNTKRAAEEISRRLAMNGFPTEYISGDLPQKKRLSIITKLKAGEAEFLVATDVAARGLHIDNLDMVVNYDLPEDIEAYVHRIGRTARAGESGKAVTLACERYVFSLDAIERYINQKIPVGELTPDLYREDASAGRRIHLESGGRDRDRDGRRSRDRDGGRRSPGGERRRERPRSEGRHHEGRRHEGRSAEGRHHEGRRHEGRQEDHRDERLRGKKTPPPGRMRRSAEPVGAAPSSGDTLEQRLAYYRKKYGEDFQPTDEMLANLGGDQPRKKSKRSSGRRRSGASASRDSASRAGAGTPAPAQRAPAAGAKASPKRDAPKKASPERVHPPAGEVSREEPRGIVGKLKGLFGARKK